MDRAAKMFEEEIIVDPEDAATVASRSKPVADRNPSNHAGVAGVASVARPVLERDPTPVIPEVQEAENYPVGVLTGKFGEAVYAVQYKTQAPLAMCASSVLAMAAVATQGLRDVYLPVVGRRPISLFMLTLAESGERKSSADRLVRAALDIRQNELHEEYKAALPSYKKAQQAYESAEKEALSKNKTFASKKAALDELGPEPVSPLSHLLTADEVSFEAVVKQMLTGQPTFGLWTDEGGQFFGGYSMKEENKVSTISNLSKLWDGSSITRIRATNNETSVLKNRRLSGHWMIQPTLASKIFRDKESRGQGMLARMLVCYPETTRGTRLFRPDDNNVVQDIEAFKDHILGILRKPLPLVEGTRNELDPPLLGMSDDAQSLWEAFHDYVEREQAPERKLNSLSDWASKAAEHTGRIAAVLTLIDDPEAEVIQKGRMSDAIELTQYYLGEFSRMMGATLTIDAASQDAEALRKWLTGKWEHKLISPRIVTQYGPTSFRGKSDTARRAIDKLVANGWLVKMPGKHEIDGINYKEVYQIVTEGED